jgi:hypothetical protein
MGNKLSLASSADLAPDAAGEVDDRLFPLPLTPFEYYFQLEDRPDYPGVVPIELECRGHLDRAALEQAYCLTHARHPILSARVDTDTKGWPSWVRGTPEPIRWADRPGVWRCERSEPRPGVRLEVRDKEGQVRFLFAFRHVAVDGLGAFQFIADLFVAYAHFCADGGDPPPWRKLNPELLRDRDGHQLFGRRLKLVDFVRMARVHVPLSFRQAALVSEEPRRRTDDALVPNAPTDFLVHHLTEEETAELSRVAGQRSVMLNDLLVRDYFLMLAEWNRGTAQARRPIRILIPTNMRRREDLRMPAANVFSYAFITRKARDCQDRQVLLESIRDEMAAIKRDKRGLYYEAAMRLICLCPPLLRWSLNRKWSFATGVFTNLGTGFDHVPVPTRDGRKVAGDLLFEIGAGAGPIRPDTRISFAAHIYAGRLAISARCDALTLTPAQQQALLNDYIERLRTTISSES